VAFELDIPFEDEDLNALGRFERDFRRGMDEERRRRGLHDADDASG
jgi:hypothetical protein